MKYIALLRGINVGGKGIISMSDLRNLFESLGYTDVSTYIQSGNVIFSHPSSSSEAELAKNIETKIQKDLHLSVKVLVLSKTSLEKIVAEAPPEWSTRSDIRKYVTFVIPPMSVEMVAKKVKLREDVDFLALGRGVLYMTTLLSGITKSGFAKLVGTSEYKSLTIRNYNTVTKLLDKRSSE